MLNNLIYHGSKAASILGYFLYKFDGSGWMINCDGVTNHLGMMMATLLQEEWCFIESRIIGTSMAGPRQGQHSRSH